MSAWQSEYVESNGIRLHYTRTGGDRPPFVLAHGFSDDGLCWTPLAECLALDYDVLMVDARGHGRSDAPGAGYGDRISAEDLAGLITALGLEKPPILGHSMGALTALTLAGLYPDLPGAILLEDPPARWTPPSPVEENDEDAVDWRAQSVAWITDLQSKSREDVIAEQRAASDWSEAELGPWADAKLSMSLNVLSRNRAPDMDWANLMQQITCPALLVTADPEDGSLVTAEEAVQLQALVPQLQVAHIAGAGHNIRREQFDAYLGVVLDFLAENRQTGHG